MKRRWLLSGVAAIGACSLLPQTPYVERRDWPLDVRRPSSAPPKQRGRILLVRNVRAAPGLESRGLQWLQHDGSVHVDFHEQWAVPPAQAVENDLRRWLADAGLFAAVVPPGSRLHADFVLEGELTAFIADLEAGVSRVAFAFVLLDQRTGRTKVLLQRTETAEVSLAGREPAAISDATRSAIAEVLRHAETNVAAAVH